MAVNLSPVGGVAAQFFTNSGVPLTGGKIFTYAAGTTTPQASYTTSQGNVAWTNPIVLDAAGRVPSGGEIWITDGLIYKFVLKDANDVLIATYDNITGINSNAVAYTNQQEIVTATAGQTVFNLGISYQPATNSLSVFVDGVNQYGPGAQYSYVETDSNTVTFNAGLHVGAEVKFTTTQQQGAGAVDASQVTYDPPFTGSVATNVEAKLAQTVSVMDFGAVGDGVADDTAAIQAALDCVPNGPDSYCPSKLTGGAGRVSIYFPSGTYKVTQPLDCSSRDYVRMTGDGRATILATHNSYIFDMTSADHCEMIGLRLYSSTASIGIYINRCTCNPYAMFNVFRNVSITLGTSTTANTNQGTIAVYNNRGEQNLFENLELRADVPYWSQHTYDGSIPPLFGPANTSIVSDTLCTHISCSFISNGPQNFATVLKGCIGFEFLNCYWAQAALNTGSCTYAVYAEGLNRCRFTGDVEMLGRFMAVSGYNYSHTIDIAMQVGQLDAGGVINMSDIAGTNVFADGYVSIMAAGGVPAAGACVFKASSGPSVTISGNIVKTVDPIIPITAVSTATVANNILQTEQSTNACLVVTGATASTASGTPVTLFSASAYSAYQVYAWVLGGGAPFMASGVVINDNTGVGLLSYDHGAYLALSVSGANVQATQTSGSSNAIQYKFVKM